MRIKYFTLLYLVLSLLPLIVSKSVAQINIEFDDTKWLLRTSSTTPPPYLNVSMPPEVMDAYIVADTLRKSFGLHQIDSIANRLSADSIAIAFRSMLAAQDYNPILFQHAIGHSRIIGSPGYLTPLISIVKAIERNYFQRVLQANRYDSIRNTSSGGIYHVRVRHQEHRVDSVAELHPSFIPYVDAYYAELEVLTPIFGTTIPFTCIDPVTELRYACMKTSWHRYPRMWEPRVNSDSAYQQVGPGRLIPDNEYIVFIETWALYVAPGGWIVYELPPEKALTVENGTVLDPENYCGLGVAVELQHFIDTLRAHILSTP
ncbi:MAG TPA: hypothetical protein PK916_07585 [Bacteroidota bacterium]|nr:hypothetical protein [Bacteroidota bacterium]